jgi:hypothetical protein
LPAAGGVETERDFGTGPRKNDTPRFFDRLNGYPYSFSPLSFPDAGLRAGEPLHSAADSFSSIRDYWNLNVVVFFQLPLELFLRLLVGAFLLFYLNPQSTYFLLKTVVLLKTILHSLFDLGPGNRAHKCYPSGPNDKH